MKITWFGTATLAVEDGDTRLLLDPFTRMNKKLPRLCIGDFTGYDYLLLSHGHFDHMMDVPAVFGVPGFRESGKLLINARAETAEEKPTCAAAFRTQRAVLPADGFF